VFVRLPSLGLRLSEVYFRSQRLTSQWSGHGLPAPKKGTPRNN
jgi:hypothetical protein